MFIIWGTHTYKKLLGTAQMVNCGHCSNVVPFQIVRARTWFTLFWIPLIPLSTKYFIVCPICGSGVQVKKDQAFAELTASEPPQLN